MITNRKIVQLSLISIGILLFLATYFFYPNIDANKFTKKETLKDEMVEIDGANLFKNVEYLGSTSSHTFSVRAENSYIAKDSPSIVNMTNMKVVLYMNDGRIMIITSDKGKYNKSTQNTFFEQNVKATDGETIVFAENFDLLMSEDRATIYNDVILDNGKGSLRADKIEYDFKTRYYKISMFDDKKVKIKLTE